MEELISKTIPKNIRLTRELKLTEAECETDILKRLQSIAALNSTKWRTYIGMGYYNCITPTPILRNIFENPGQFQVKTGCFARVIKCLIIRRLLFYRNE